MFSGGSIEGGFDSWIFMDDEVLLKTLRVTYDAIIKAKLRAKANGNEVLFLKEIERAKILQEIARSRGLKC